MPKVTLKGFILVPESDLDAVKNALVIHKRLTQAEPGCIVFEVIQSKTNPHRFDVYEEFIDKESFELHQARVKSSTWAKVSVNVERHYEILE